MKRKEDERRRNIEPSDTLFVVNFNEATTKREELQLLFEPFGDLVRIDMKRNYAFVQFKTVDEASRAKEKTNGGKLDQSVLTVEFVARPRMDDFRRRDSGRRMNAPAGRRGDRFDDRRRYDGPSLGGSGGGPSHSDRGYDRDRRYDRDRHGGYERERRSRSPPGYRRRSRSRSRSPGGRYSHRDRSPARSSRYNDRYHDPARDGTRNSPVPEGRRSPAVDDRDPYNRPPVDHRDRDRGYRSVF